MFVSEDGTVTGSIDRARVAELLAQTDDADLQVYYRELLGESEDGKTAAEDAGEQSAESQQAETEPAPPDVDLDDLRAQADALGIKVDRRWGEQRLRDEIAAKEAKDGSEK